MTSSPAYFYELATKIRIILFLRKRLRSFFHHLRIKGKETAKKILRNDRSQSGFTRNDNVSGTVPDTF